MKYGMYIYEGDFASTEFREGLILEAVGAYCAAHDIGCEDMKIVRSQKGKPYIIDTERDVYCNVSHTGNMWVCIVGEAECGVDIQLVKDCKYEQLSRRYFTKDEQRYIDNYGLSGFFRLWVRREAFGKYTGDGFYGEKPALVDSEGWLIDSVGDGFLKDVPIAEDIICAYCTGGEEDDIEICL